MGIPLTSDFNKASASTKEAMLLDGYRHMAAQIEKMRVEMCILNNWIEQLPTLIEKGKCNVPNIETLGNILQTMEGNQDGLTVEFIRQTEVLGKLTNFLLNNKFV